ncbi:MAG TPA: RNA-binding protein [Dehalococcoidia bacterium]|nr:RNA-binding protein [Dehalococcoidia bacterium]
MNIHVGNLAREVTEAELRKAFEEFGQVAAVRIITDRYSGVSKGFGFVEMPKRAEAEAAITGLNMKELAGRTLDLSEARGPRERGRTSRPHGGGGRGRPSGGGRRRF